MKLKVSFFFLIGIFALVLAAVVLSGCGSTSSSTQSGGTTPVVDDGGGDGGGGSDNGGDGDNGGGDNGGGDGGGSEEEPEPVVTQGARNFWVWSNIETKIQDPNTFLSSVESYATGYDITLYVNLHPTSIATDAIYRANLRAFLREAHSRDISVEALGGETDWIDQPDLAVENLVQATIDFNNGTSDTTDNFDGIHMDVEPHGHSSWSEIDNQILLSDFLTLFDTVKSAAGELPVNADIPPWYFNNESKVLVQVGSETKPVGEFVSEKNVGIQLMSYRDTAAGIVEFSESAITYAVNTAIPAGRLFLFGVDTGEDASYPYTTYYGSTYSAIDADLDTLYATYGIGSAIHHWDQLITLAP